MTDKEFKRLSRAQLIEIIYQLQLQVDKLTEENYSLENALADKRLRIDNAGSLAKAALEINDCFQNAQNAADQYLNEVKEIIAKAEEKGQKIIADAQEKADLILASTLKTTVENNIVLEEFFKKYE